MALSRQYLLCTIFSFLFLGVHLHDESPNWYALNDETVYEADIRLLNEPHRVRRSTLAQSNNNPAGLETTTKNIDIKATYAKAEVQTVTPPPVPVSPLVETTEPPTAAPAVSQHIPNVGVNGSGILKNLTKVSEPIAEPNNSNDQEKNNASAKGIPEVSGKVFPDQQLDNLTKTNFEYYNSTFIGNKEYFDKVWANVTKMVFVIHPILSSSHRRATTVNLNFEFPFYGQNLKNLTIATGGFIYTGEQVHNWLAATQYIAPLMANFDTRVTNDSVVKIADDGSNFTVIWENVVLQNYVNQSFTFAVTLRKDGDIIFAYKDIPIAVQMIEDKDHPVKVGISDAYVNDQFVFMKRRKTIFEYHRINFLKHNITSKTLIVLHPNPTCLLFNTCSDCINHVNTNFTCYWCPAIGRCSSGTDRKKQDWLLRNCNQNQITTIEQCAALPKTKNNTTAGPAKKILHDIVSTHDYTNKTSADGLKEALVSPKVGPAHSSMGGLIVVLLIMGLLGAGSGWAFYAYKNPHTRSGQLLIKYRPSTWSWKRGEARYTAATIHM